MVHDLGLDKTSCGICPYKDAQTEEQIDLGGIECIAVLHDDARELVNRQQETIASLINTICKYRKQLFPDYISCQISDENESGCHASHKPEWFCADGEKW